MTKIVLFCLFYPCTLLFCQFVIWNISVIDNLVGQPSAGNLRAARILVTASQMPSHVKINDTMER